MNASPLCYAGRTHQIRAQFAAEGAPLVGDALYAPQPTEAAGERREAPGADGCLGLQAFRLRVNDPVMGAPPREFLAGLPWWRLPANT